MKTKNFNAKKMLMSTVAAVVFSFVFTAHADARPSQYMQDASIEVQKCPETPQEKPEESESVISYILHTIFGVRV